MRKYVGGGDTAFQRAGQGLRQLTCGGQGATKVVITVKENTTMALQLIIHTFRMVFGNLGQALRISIGPYLILIIGVFAVFAAISPTLNSTVGVNPAVGFLSFLIFPLILFVTAWVAVSWHRFILKEEYAGLLPAVKGRPIWPYVGKAILLGLLLFVIAIPVFMLFSFMVMPIIGTNIGDPMNFRSDLPVSAILVFALAYIAIGFIALRLGVSLVGTALEKPMSFRDAWSATKPVAGTMLGVTIIMVLINIVPGNVFPYLLASVPIISFVIDVIINWITMMLGISILTTIYGHVIENRPLVS